MLACLRVSQFAIIDELELEPGPGLNVITGETGAGKSILVHALQLVLGARARPEAIRSGASEASVEALFTLDDLPEVRARLAGLDLTGDEVVIRRVIADNGRTRAWIDGRMATIGQLQALAAGLVDISSQHEHHSLADPSSHLGYLDAFADHPTLIEGTAAAFADALAAESEHRSLAEKAAGRVDREELIRFQLAEIDKVAPRPGEDDALRAEVDRLRHAAALGAATGRAEDALYAGPQAVTGVLARISADLEQAARRDPRLAPLLAQVESARLELVDAAEALGRYSQAVVVDPERLAEAEERLQALARLARRFGGSLAASIEARERLSADLALFDDVDAALTASAARAGAAAESALVAARALSASRHAAARSLGAAITAELASLGMGGADVRIDVAPLTGPGLLRDGVVLGPSGIDRAEFLIAPNRGEEPRPLGRVASGGELSRSLLAIKRVLAGLGPVGTYVFDEVDTGVGGAVADTIGRKLWEVGRHHQVLCITHHPQIAAWGRQHFHVRKDVQHGRTLSAIHPLLPTDRVEELARMLGGSTVTETTRKAAAELLEHARA